MRQSTRQDLEVGLELECRRQSGREMILSRDRDLPQRRTPEGEMSTLHSIISMHHFYARKINLDRATSVASPYTVPRLEELNANKSAAVTRALAVSCLAGAALSSFAQLGNNSPSLDISGGCNRTEWVEGPWE